MRLAVLLSAIRLPRLTLLSPQLIDDLPREFYDSQFDPVLRMFEELPDTFEGLCPLSFTTYFNRLLTSDL